MNVQELKENLGIKVRRSLYNFARGASARKWVRFLDWNVPDALGTFGSSSQLPALHPLLASTDLIRNGPPLGVDRLTNQPILESVRGLYKNGYVNSPNETILGGLGTAKSSYVKLSLLRLISVGGRACVFDRKRQQHNADGVQVAVTGEYSKLATAVGGAHIAFNQDPAVGTRINIFDPSIASSTMKGQTALLGQDRLLAMVTEAAMDARLTPEQRWALQQAHKTASNLASEANRVCTIADVINALGSPSHSSLPGISPEQLREWGIHPLLALHRYIDGGDLAGLIDGETSGPNGTPVSLDAPLLVFDTSALEHGSTALGVMMAVTVAYLTAVWINVPGPKSVVVEETYSADGIGVIPEMFRDLAKRVRGVGASMISVFHHLSDIREDSPLRTLITESEAVAVFRQDKADDVDAAIKLLSLDPSLREMIMTLPRGTHIKKRGPRLPVVVVEPTRTEVEKYITYTDDAIEV